MKETIGRIGLFSVCVFIRVKKRGPRSNNSGTININVHFDNDVGNVINIIHIDNNRLSLTMKF